MPVFHFWCLQTTIKEQQHFEPQDSTYKIIGVSHAKKQEKLSWLFQQAFNPDSHTCFLWYIWVSSCMLSLITYLPSYWIQYINITGCYFFFKESACNCGVFLGRVILPASKPCYVGIFYQNINNMGTYYGKPHKTNLNIGTGGSSYRKFYFLNKQNLFFQFSNK